MVKSKLKVMEIEEKKVDKASEEVVEAEVVRVESQDSPVKNEPEELPFG